MFLNFCFLNKSYPIYDSVDLVRKTLPKVLDVTKYSVYKNDHYHILMFLFYKTFGRVIYQQNHIFIIRSKITTE